MRAKLDYPEGATPLDPDESAGLIPSHVATQSQLNEWEQQNILEGERWAFSRRKLNPFHSNSPKTFTNICSEGPGNGPDDFVQQKKTSVSIRGLSQ